MKKLNMSIAFALATIALCLIAPAPRAQKSGQGYLLNMYHFNIQYVVGSEYAMNSIIKNSFDPLVDFYLDHPGWGADFEMQGEMIEYMAKNFPETLAKFKKLINSGQCELVTFHYGDALLLAFPRIDQEWSLKLNEKVLADNGIQRSNVIFAQEAQWGQGYAAVGKDHGYDISIITPGHFGWFQDDDGFPFFHVDDMSVLVNREATEPTTGISVKWDFVGDGALVVTGGMNPYFPGLFREKPLLVAAMAKKFERYEQDGYKIAKVSEYVQALKDAGVRPRPLPPVLDSPWRPEDGSGVFQWMGKYNFPWERDYDIRTQNARLRAVLVEAERAGVKPETLLEAWRWMISAEVSDPTGWNPTPGEVKWDYDVMFKALAVLQSDPAVDLPALRKTAEKVPACGDIVDPPLQLSLTGNARNAAVEWRQLTGDDELEGYCVSVKWQGKGDASVSFPWDAQKVVYSPAFLESELRAVKLSEIKGKPIHLALTNGLIGLGQGRILVRDNQAGFIAAGLYPAEKRIGFDIENGRETGYALKFYLFAGQCPRGVLRFANELNRSVMDPACGCDN